MTYTEIKKELVNVYIKTIIPAVVLILLVYLLKYLNLLGDSLLSPKWYSVVLFVLGAAFSLAFPIFYRTVFVNKNQKNKTINVDEFVVFEKKLIILALVVPYLLVLAVPFQMPGFYLGGLMLFSLYSVYYYYPSEKRTVFEMKLFRIKEPD